jgi:hypothetical protein
MRLRLNLPGASADGWFINWLEIEDLFQLMDGPEPAAGLFARYTRYYDGELYLPHWHVLVFCDANGQPAKIDERLLQAAEATVSILPDAPLQLGGASLDDWSTDGAMIRGRLLTRASRSATVNFGQSALDAIGAQAGDCLELDVEGDVRKLMLLPYKGLDRERPGAPAANRRCSLYVTEGDELARWLLAVKNSKKLDDGIVRLADDEIQVDAAQLVKLDGGNLVKMAGRHVQSIHEKAAKGQPLVVPIRPFARPPALCGAVVPHWGDQDRDVLWIEAETYVRDPTLTRNWDLALPVEIAALPGARVTLRRT